MTAILLTPNPRLIRIRFSRRPNQVAHFLEKTRSFGARHLLGPPRPHPLHPIEGPLKTLFVPLAPATVAATRLALRVFDPIDRANPPRPAVIAPDHCAEVLLQPLPRPTIRQ